MLKDYAEKYFFDGNFNCAETILHAANEYYGLNLSDREMILVGGFGAGMQTGNICGTLLAAISIFSLRYIEAKAHESTEIKPAVALLIRRFRESFGGFTLCKDIKPVYFDRERRCIRTVAKACDVIEAVIEEYEKGKNE